MSDWGACDNCGKTGIPLKSVTLRGEDQSWCAGCIENGKKGQTSVDTFRQHVGNSNSKPLFRVNEAATHECPKCGSPAVPVRRNPKDPMDLSNPRWFCQECNKFLKEDYQEKTLEHKFEPMKGQTGCAKCGYAAGHHPNAQQLKQIQNEAVSIRPSKYRDKEGFTVYGDQAKIFTPTRDKAERIADVLRTKSGDERNKAVDKILLESWKVEVIADNSGKWCTNSMRYASKEEAEKAGRSLESRWMAVREMRVTQTDDPVYPPIKESVNLLVKLRTKDYVGASEAFARLMQEKVNVLLAEERRNLLLEAEHCCHIPGNTKPCPACPKSMGGTLPNPVKEGVNVTNKTNIPLSSKSKDINIKKEAADDDESTKIGRIPKSDFADRKDYPGRTIGQVNPQLKGLIDRKEKALRSGQSQFSKAEQQRMGWNEDFPSPSNPMPVGGVKDHRYDRELGEAEGHKPGCTYLTAKGCNCGRQAELDKAPHWSKKYATEEVKTFRAFITEAKVECQECGKVFNAKVGPGAEPKCPKCGGYDVELAEGVNESAEDPRKDSPHAFVGDHNRPLNCARCGVPKKDHPWANYSSSETGAYKRTTVTEGLVDTIHAGDRVTIVNRFGQERSGKAVMRGPAGWVLNMGGPHGTPGIASDENIVKVNSRGAKTNAWGLAKESVSTPNVKITNSYREDGGRWFVEPSDTKKMTYIKKMLADMQAEEPNAGWKLETSGTVSAMHTWKEGYRGDPYTMTAKYNTICPETGKPIKKGDQCVFYPKSKKAYHMDSKSAQDWLSQAAADSMGLGDAGW